MKNKNEMDETWRKKKLKQMNGIHGMSLILQSAKPRTYGSAKHLHPLQLGMASRDPNTHCPGTGTFPATLLGEGNAKFIFYYYSICFLNLL